MKNNGPAVLFAGLLLAGCEATPEEKASVRFNDLVRHEAAGTVENQRNQGVLPERIGEVRPAHTGEENPCVYVIYITGEHRYTCPL